MREIPGVQNKLRLTPHPVDLVNGGLKGPGNIRVGRLVEADMAVADLDESKVLLLLRRRTQQPRGRHAAREAPHQARACPLHALKETASVDVARYGQLLC